MAVAEMFKAVMWPHDSLIDSHEDGCTEPWIAEIVTAILKGIGGQPAVLETGGFRGTTSAWIALAIADMGGGRLWVAEIDSSRQLGIVDRLAALPLGNVQWTVAPVDVLLLIASMKDESLDLAFVDDDHSKLHVEQEIVALWPKMKKGGIICFHDVSSDGVCQLGPLIKKYGGIALDLPRLGPDGGLGIIQIPR